VLLDQRKLPSQEVYLTCRNVDEVIDAIKSMVVRGAPAIGITAAYGAVLSIIEHSHVAGHSYQQVESLYLADLKKLAKARPTAVNLIWAIELMRTAFDECFAEVSKDAACADLNCEALLDLAKSIHAQDIENNILMGALASDVLADHSGEPFSVLTHCNAGALATGGYGTALGAIRTAWSKQIIDMVYADETRPWLQGARLTAWELARDNIPVCINSDVAAAWLFANKNIKWVIVGADRVAANGDVANKIGTYGLAIMAKYHQVKLMVVAPSSTVDMSVSSGELIDIEMRDGIELTHIDGKQITPDKVTVINPVFDITPSTLIDCIVTEKGVIHHPNTVKMRHLFN
jgi:methylthioribose-1-phosphate isomerase